MDARYPKCKYHPTEDPVVVQNAAEEDALGYGWGDHPDGPFKEKPKPVKPPKLNADTYSSAPKQPTA